MAKKWMVGLGNPEPKFEKTRHNVGFMAVLRYAQKAGYQGWREKHESSYLRHAEAENQLTLLMPLTYMNESGRSLQKWRAKDGLEASEILVIYDDMDLPLGKIRYRAAGSGGSHNGMASIIECLGSDRFSRLRVGIGKPENPEDWADYVLRRFSKEEFAVLDGVLDKSVDAMKDWFEGLNREHLMSKYNA
jgi:PTH1 family peptidyl-tRNA hydrolase